MASLRSDLDTMIVPKLALHDPAPVGRVVARQFATSEPRRWPWLLWLLGAAVLVVGLIEPIDPVSQARALRLSTQAQRVLDALNQ
jgi:hypothetical protein